MNNGKISPLSLSMDGILRKEALVVITNLIQLKAKKREEPFSHVCEWVNIQIINAVARF